MSIDLHVRVTSKGMQEKIQEYTGDKGLYENPSELVRAALRRFFSSEESQEIQADRNAIGALAEQSLSNSRYFEDSPELRQKMKDRVTKHRKSIQ